MTGPYERNSIRLDDSASLRANGEARSSGRQPDSVSLSQVLGVIRWLETERSEGEYSSQGREEISGTSGVVSEKSEPS